MNKFFKSISMILALLAIVSFTFTGCSDDDSSSPAAAVCDKTSLPATAGLDGGANVYISALKNNLFENVGIGGTAATDIAALISDNDEDPGSSSTDEWDDKSDNTLVAALTSFTAPAGSWGATSGASEFVPSSNPADPAPFTAEITDWAGNSFTPGSYLGAIDQTGSNWVEGWTSYTDSTANCDPTGNYIVSVVAPADFTDVDNSSGCGAGTELEVGDENDCDEETGVPNENDTAEVAGGSITVTYNSDGYWVYNATTATNACAGIAGATVISGNVQIKFAAGTTIVADPGSSSYLNIRPGAQIHAVGTSTNPVVFTSNKTAGTRSSSDWGGIVIHGKAKCNTESGVNTASDTEIATGSYGGDDNNDNSGILQYVRIEFAGYELAAGKEFNGLFLAGVGDGTTIDHIQVHKGSDDGIEIFGGTVNLDHIVLTYNEDDGFDLDDGWHGHAHHFIIAKGSDKGDSVIEYDGKGKDGDRVTQSFFSNFTFLGQGDGKKDTLFNIKKDGSLVIVNSIFANFDNQWLVHKGETDKTPNYCFYAGAE